MKRYFTFLIFATSFLIGESQNVGIGTTTPKAAFNVADGKTVLFGADSAGPGSKLVWYANKGALVAGAPLSPNSWTSEGLGFYSVGFGNSFSKGTYAFSAGASDANGYASTAIGRSTANGDLSVALGGSGSNGLYSTSSGFSFAAADYSLALGRSTAKGLYSSASGYSTANADYSVALGRSTTDGYHSTAIGSLSYASGNYSTALGYQASTNGHSYSICIGASGSNPGNPSVANENDNEFMVYADYYRLWTGLGGTSVFLTPGANAWLGSCDKNKKENLAPLNGEEVLQKLAAINFSSWNYKTQDPKKFRHYGIMAQDFFNAFGHDAYGIIGCDTLVNPIDMIGIDMAAIQALEKRTQKIEALQKENAVLKTSINDLTATIQQMQQALELLTCKQEAVEKINFVKK